METPLTSIENRAQTLKNCSFLRGLKDGVLSDLATKAETLRIGADETIITRGESGSETFPVLQLGRQE